MSVIIHEGAAPRVLLRIGIIGGGEFCREILLKSIEDYRTKHVRGQFVAVADPDPQAPGLLFAQEIGLFTTTDYHDFYDPELDINQLFIFTPDETILKDVLATRPHHIRFLSYHTARLFWDIIKVEENKIKFQRDELSTIIHGIQDGIVVMDNNYNILQVNHGLLEQSGFIEAEVIGRKCHEVFHLSENPCEPPNHPCPLKQAATIDQPVQATHVHYTLEGDQRIVDLSIYPLKDMDGRITRFIEISRDITTRYREQEKMTRDLEEAVAQRTREIEEAHRKLLQQDKMSSLGKLSASMVHELNNPLAGVLNFTLLIKRVLKERELTPEVAMKILSHLDLMETETRRCSKIVSNLLVFSRRSKLEPREADLNEILERVLELNAHHLSLLKVQVTTDFQPDLPLIFGDEGRLQQVFMNLILNAAEGIPEGKPGHLTLSTTYDPEEDMLQARVTDTGSGIPLDHLPHIFEPFFTTKSEGRGVGLGLSVAYGIIKEHNGQIEVQETSPSGTTFLIKLPVYRPDRQSKVNHF